MVNPIERSPFPYGEEKKVRKTTGRRRNLPTDEGVKISINPETVEKVDDLLAERKVKEIKNLIREGKYPLDQERLAKKIVNFLLDGG